MNGLLKNKVAIITGGSRGIGKAIAERFAREGCNLMIAARTSQELDQTAHEIQTKFQAKVLKHQTDISNESDVDSMIQSTIAEFGKIDILINNAAAIGPMGGIESINTDDFFNTLRTNIGGTIFCVQAVLPYMKQNNCGWIINLSGGGALYPLPYYDAYSASKTSIVRLTENFAIEFEKYSIMVTAISPGAVNTKMFEEQLKVDKDSIGEKNWEAIQKRLASGGDPIDKAPELALYLVSEQRNEFNGKVISAIWDDWENISKNKDRLTDTDIYTMRRTVPKDRDIEL